MLWFFRDDKLWFKAVTLGSEASIAIVLVGRLREAVIVLVIKLDSDEAIFKSILGFSRLRV